MLAVTLDEGETAIIEVPQPDGSTVEVRVACTKRAGHRASVAIDAPREYRIRRSRGTKRR